MCEQDNSSNLLLNYTVSVTTKTDSVPLIIKIIFVLYQRENEIYTFICNLNDQKTEFQFLRY